MVALAGLPEVRDVLYESHPSSLRLFDEYPLERLSDKGVRQVVQRCLADANKGHPDGITIEPNGEHALVKLSEGYPHFIQQFGYSAFEMDEDGKIDENDVIIGAIGSGGALERIGDRYYRDDFYRKIQKDSYRQVLRIMAGEWDQWTTKAKIRSSFKGKDSTLDNAIHALRTRRIILSKEGARGVYRLQDRGFALWIKLYTKEKEGVEPAVDLFSITRRENPNVGSDERGT